MESIENFVDTRGELKFINNNNSNIKEEFISINRKNVIRGIHCSPYGKIITCLKGKCIDYKKDFINADNVMAKGFLLGCHHGMTLEDVDYVFNLLEKMN